MSKPARTLIFGALLTAFIVAATAVSSPWYVTVSVTALGLWWALQYAEQWLAEEIEQAKRELADRQAIR